jgi:putative spermidine/putrescine transport system ATP-binding protein
LVEEEAAAKRKLEERDKMPKLELESLHKRFGEVVAVRSIDLTIESGEFVSLLGPSGCGKTTTLLMIAGFEHPDAGRVLVGGKDITFMPPNRRNMGMVFQAYSLFPNLTARQNVEFGLRIRRRPTAERQRRAAELLELVGLAAVADRYPYQLSGGQQQRVALARALAIEPEVLLLDEPLSALDAKVRVQLREEIRHIQTQLGITTIYVTHDQEEALSLSDRVAVLSQGIIEQVGTPAEIYDNPRTLFVAQFVGTMNCIRGEVCTSNPGFIACNGILLPVDAARTWSGGQHVVVLIRPEAIRLGHASDVSSSAAQVEGKVVGRSFLGSVTRLQIETLVGEMVVDTSSTEALALPEGTPVVLSWDAAHPRLFDAVSFAPENTTVSVVPTAVSALHNRV